MLTEDQKKDLLRVARASALGQITGAQQTIELPQTLPQASGVFVTIKKHGELRGCLGTLGCRDELGAEVARCARDSASADPRFPPVSTMEIPELSFEISVLTPLEQVDPSLEDTIIVGRHGLLVEEGRRRGLLLPQVATEWGWTREQFLRQTCRKAGLPDDAWQMGAQVYRFEAEVFGD